MPYSTMAMMHRIRIAMMTQSSLKSCGGKQLFFLPQ
jgi:hypothetical protein